MEKWRRGGGWGAGTWLYFCNFFVNLKLLQSEFFSLLKKHFVRLGGREFAYQTRGLVSVFVNKMLRAGCIPVGRSFVCHSGAHRLISSTELTWCGGRVPVILAVGM